MSIVPGFKDLFDPTNVKGILKIKKDENGFVGVEIQDLLTINNQLYQEGSKTLGTHGNLCLLNSTSDLLRITPSPETNVIELTYLKSIRGTSVYQDSQGIKYAYITGADEPILMAVGDIDDSGDVSFTSIIPQWNANSTFLLTDKQTSVNLTYFNYKLSTTTSSTIVFPSSITSFVAFSGRNITLDIHHCTGLIPENIGSDWGTVTGSRLLVLEQIYSRLEDRISEGVLDGKINIQVYTPDEEES